MADDTPVIMTPGMNMVQIIELRDYFAAMAMQGLLASGADDSGDIGFDDISADAYGLADAMLAERSTNRH